MRLYVRKLFVQLFAPNTTNKLFKAIIRPLSWLLRYCMIKNPRAIPEPEIPYRTVMAIIIRVAK